MKKIPLCLDSGQKDEVAEMLLQMKGYVKFNKQENQGGDLLGFLYMILYF